MGHRHPKACPHLLLDHLVFLEALLDKSIGKAEVCVAEGKLLGHSIGRHCQAVTDFPPLKEKLHIQQFLGCANWLRGYLPAEYGHAAKILGQWQKPGAEFPAQQVAWDPSPPRMCDHITLAAFDEDAVADGSCPLEQVADASGIAVGGSVVQMSRDMAKLKVLMTHSKSLTPAQQNWPPLIEDAFAQLELKRVIRKVFGLDRPRQSDQGSDL